MRRQRSAARDSSACHTDTGHHTWVVLPTTIYPRAGRRGGHAATAWVIQSSPLWKQAEQQGGDRTHAHPNAVTRPAAGRDHGADMRLPDPRHQHVLSRSE
eukprot:1798568-Prymnesium_polylepis.1